MRAPPLVFAALLVAPTALADARVSVPAGGGLGALDVKVDVAAASVTANGASVPIGLDRAQLPAQDRVVVEAVAIGKGRQVAHVKVPAKDVDGLAWEAILAAGKPSPVFAGLTGFVAGDPGERTGKAIDIVRGDGTSFVVVGDVREDVGICGQPVTLLDPQGLYPASMDLRPATVQRLSPERQQQAVPVIARDKGPAADKPLARLLVARGSSVADDPGAALTDGDPATVWSEQRPGIGQGEFVQMLVPEAAPISRLQIVPVAPSPEKDAAAPRTLYLVTQTQAFAISFPEDAARKPGEAYEVDLPAPIAASCVALVLSDAYARGLPHPQVGVAELVAFSEVDTPGATLLDVAKKLSSDRGAAAAQVLERAGPAALQAVEQAYDGLDARGRALAVDVAASHDACVEAAPLLARGLCEATGEAPRKAREKLQRCKPAAGVLASKMVDDATSRACIAPVLVALAGVDALTPIADAMARTGEDERDVRAVLRTAFADALETAPPDRLGALLGDARRSPIARLEMMRAAGPHLKDALAPAAFSMADALGGAPSMRTRYVALGPLAEMAKDGDGGAAARIAMTMQRDPEWPVRARAAELGASLAPVQSALVAAAGDAEPRVREAALQALAASSPPPAAAVEAARRTVQDDGWSFVRVRAIGVLTRAAPSALVDSAFQTALDDESPRVRGAAIVAISLRRAAALRGPVRKRLDDRDEDPDVRAAAARALGVLCDASSADRLTELARDLASPETADEEPSIALAALVGLAALQPPDLRSRLAPLLSGHASAAVRQAAQKALEARGVCR